MATVTKCAYTQPLLQRLGSVSELTASGSNPGTENSAGKPGNSCNGVNYTHHTCL